MVALGYGGEYSLEALGRRERVRHFYYVGARCCGVVLSFDAASVCGAKRRRGRVSRSESVPGISGSSHVEVSRK